MPLRTLSLYAQRVGKVFASATTWARLVRERGWRPPRLRVHTKMPHPAFRGHTPDEVYFRTAPNLQIELDDARRKARDSRLATNRSVSCGRCTTVPAGIPP